MSSTDSQQRPSISRRNFFKLAGGAAGVGAAYYYGLSKQPPTAVPQTNRPAYVDGGIGLPVFRGPYLQEDAQIAAFLFPADADRLTAVCDQYLNAPGDGRIQYAPLSSHIVVAFADMFISSLDERDSQIGRLPETEVAFWLLTVAKRRVGDVYVPDHLAWFLPCLFVDNSYAIATGREVYGFNKLAARFEKPDRIQEPAFSVDVLGFKAFSPQAEGKMERLLEIGREAVAPEINEQPDAGGKEVETLTRFLNDSTPIVFLKQFRSAANAEEACYQAIIEAPIKVQQFHQGGSLAGDYTMRLNHLDSHPLAQMLGLKEGVQRPLAALWMKIDFVLEAGVEIWRAA